MATIRKRGNRYEVQIRKKGGAPVSKSFLLRSDALAWARKVESEIDRGVFVDITEAQQTTLNEALSRFGTGKYSSKSWSSHARTVDEHLGHLTLAQLTGSILARYRDNRLKTVSTQTVIHELGLITRVLKTCVIDWGIHLPKGIPAVSKPKLPRGRDRRLEPGEERALIAALSTSQEVQSIVRLALETAMRREELTNIDWEDVDFKKRTLRIPKTKTGISRRIPLSSYAVEIMKSQIRQLSGRVFSVRPDSVTQAFTRACKRAGIDNLRFHDLRHEATSRLFEMGLGVMEVASITGHKDLRMLRRYTHLRAEDLVSKLG